MTCRRYSVYWVRKQVKALAKQDCFWCSSASKTMNTQSHQNLRSMLEVDPPPPPPSCLPPSQMGRSQSMSADYKIVTGSFHFCLDKAAVGNDFPCSAFILDQIASIWCKEAYTDTVVCFVLLLFCFSHPPQPDCIIVRFK